MIRPGAPIAGHAASFSLAGTIDRAAARLPPALVGPEPLAAVRRIAALIPASLTSWIDFECRLQSGRPQVDLSIRIDGPSRDRLAVCSLALEESPGGAAWRRVAALAREWGNAGSPTHRNIAAAWLEFDLDAGTGASMAPPRVFIDFARARHAAGDRCRAMTAALAPIVGRPAPEWLREGLGRCLRVLPPASDLVYVGLPAHERVTSVRLCVLGMDERRAGDYLEAVGWPGDAAALRRRLGSWRRPGRDRVARSAILQFDLDDRCRIGSRLGLEYPLRRRPQVRGAVAERGFLDDLVACGACAADKRDALLAWPGCEVTILPHEIWPSLVMRRVSHVKIVCEGPDEPIEAKAYVCFAHAWRPAITGGHRRPPLSHRPPIAS
jgi:hypothetical protein